jgi:hypothetical protein
MQMEPMESDAEDDNRPLMFSSGERSVDSRLKRNRNRRLSVSGGSGKSTNLGRGLSLAILCSTFLTFLFSFDIMS